jgi:hypothetical protein
MKPTDTNLHFTLKENTLKRIDLDDFVACFFGGAGSPSLPKSKTDGPAVHPYRKRHERKETDRFKEFTYEELTKCGKVNLDIFWLKDDALEESANLPALVSGVQTSRISSQADSRPRSRIWSKRKSRCFNSLWTARIREISRTCLELFPSL